MSVEQAEQSRERDQRRSLYSIHVSGKRIQDKRRQAGRMKREYNATHTSHMYLSSRHLCDEEPWQGIYISTIKNESIRILISYLLRHKNYLIFLCSCVERERLSHTYTYGQEYVHRAHFIPRISTRIPDQSIIHGAVEFLKVDLLQAIIAFQ